MLLPNETKYQPVNPNTWHYHQTAAGLWHERHWRDISSPFAPVGLQVLLGQLHHSLKPLPESERSTRKDLLWDLIALWALSFCHPVCICATEHMLVRTLLNWAQETSMLLKSSAKSGLSNIFWAKKCWLYWSRLCFVWTSETNLLLRVLYIILQGTRSGTTNGILSWEQQQRCKCDNDGQVFRLIKKENYTKAYSSYVKLFLNSFFFFSGQIFQKKYICWTLTTAG